MQIKLNSCYAIYSWHWDIPEDEPFTMDKDKDVNKGVNLPETSRFATATSEEFLADMLEPQTTDAMSVQDLSGGD
ncbi:hypothetical protein KL938_001075 [Ogataea parapolymorpha]|nr:hypothetical protein KL938_001075 [Ogataea parapolymorpha]